MKSPGNPYGASPSVCLWVVLAVLCAAHPASGQDAGREGQRSRLSVSGPEVAVYLVAGDLRVVRGEGNRVELELGPGSWNPVIDAFAASTASAIGPALWVRISTDRVRVPWLREPMEVGVDRNGAVADDAGVSRAIRLGADAGVDVAIDATLFVPDGQRVVIRAGAARVVIEENDADLTLHLQDGTVDVKGSTSALTVRSTRADVRVHGSHGSLEVFNADGSTEVRGGRIGKAVIRTGRGGVSLGGSRFSELDVETVSGSVEGRRVEVGRGVIRTAGGAVTLIDPLPTARLEVHSATGRVTLHLPTTSPIAVEAASRSGRVTGAALVPGMEVSERAARLAHPSAGVLLVRAGSGDVRLHTTTP